jgi:hypothetical protein
MLCGGRRETMCGEGRRKTQEWREEDVISVEGREGDPMDCMLRSG